MNGKEIVNDARDVLDEYFAGIASGDYYDGTSYQLYLDLDTFEIFEFHEASDNTWLQREDGSLVKIYSVCGYSDLPKNELYNNEYDSLWDFGYNEWLDELEKKIDFEYGYMLEEIEEDE